MRLSGPSPRLIMLILAVGLFTTGLNVSVLSPLIKPIGSEFAVSDAAVGQLAALHAVAAGIVALLVAPWIDRFPRRLVLGLEATLLLGATTLSALAPTFAWLLVGRLLAGLGGAVIGAICFAAAADIFSDHRTRNRAIAFINASFSTSTIAGLPLITQVADFAGWRWGMAALLVPTALVAVGAWLLPDRTSIEGLEKLPSYYSSYQQVVSNWQVNWLLAALIVMCMALAGWIVYFGAYTVTVFAVSVHVLSALFLLFGIADIIGSGLTPMLLRLHSARAVYMASTLVMSVSLVVSGALYGTWWLLVPAVMLVGVSSAILYLTASVMLLDSMPSARGAVMALQTGCFEFGWAFGAALTGATLAYFGSYRTVYPLLGLVLASSLLFLGLSVQHARRARQPARVPDVSS